MNINLHIDRLIIDGLGIQPHQRDELKAAVTAAIREQLVAQGNGFSARSAVQQYSVNAGSIAIADNPNAESLGHQIGHAVGGGICK